MKKLFGTDGIRGRAGEYPLDDETVLRVGAAFASVTTERLGRATRFVSGCDTRETGEHIEKLFHAGAIANGASGRSAGVITTPGVACITREFDFDVGVVISASHNPYADNGIKIFLPSGRKLDQKGESAIENIVNEGRKIDVLELENVDVGQETVFLNRYLDHLSESFVGLDLRGKRIVADCANGAASALAPKLFS